MLDLEPFGVTAHRHSGGWHVYLPHQCDAWTIAGSDWSKFVATQAEAVSELERFIAEAQEALAALRLGEEYPKVTVAT
jgi:hypothetical protein